MLFEKYPTYGESAVCPWGGGRARVRLAGDAQIALDKVAKGEADAIEGWLAYGAALNEGRALFAGDREFGQWIADNDLCQLGTDEVDRHERSAAMWAAANADQLAEAKAASKARTLRSGKHPLLHMWGVFFITL